MTGNSRNTGSHSPARSRFLRYRAGAGAGSPDQLTKRVRVQEEKMGKVVVMDHPLIAHKIGIIRKKETGTREFRDIISEIAMLLCYEATRELELEDVEIETPIDSEKRSALPEIAPLVSSSTCFISTNTAGSAATMK